MWFTPEEINWWKVPHQRGVCSSFETDSDGSSLMKIEENVDFSLAEFNTVEGGSNPISIWNLQRFKDFRVCSGKKKFVLANLVEYKTEYFTAAGEEFF